MAYKENEVYISIKEKRRLHSALQRKKKKDHVFNVTVQPTGETGGEKIKLLLTSRQASRLKKGRKRVVIKMKARQLKANMKYDGGFLSVLAGLAGRALPTVLAGLSSGLLSGLVEKAVKGDGLYLQKGGHCYKVDPVEGNGLYLSPHHRVTRGDGLFLKHGGDICDGKGLLLGANSPFKNIPILGLIL